jgi:hypothetical protein
MSYVLWTKNALLKILCQTFGVTKSIHIEGIQFICGNARFARQVAYSILLMNVGKEKIVKFLRVIYFQQKDRNLTSFLS